MRVVPLMPLRTVNSRRLLQLVRRKPVNVTPPIVPCKPRSPPQQRSRARLMRLRVNVTPRQAPNRRLILSRPFRVLSVRRKTPHGRLRNPLRLRLVVRVLPVGMLKLLHRVLRMLRRPLPPRRPRRRTPRPRLPPRRLPRPMQPTGAHDAYHVGDKITYNGKHYTCLMDGCVWTPDAYPQGWREEA